MKNALRFFGWLRRDLAKPAKPGEAITEQLPIVTEKPKAAKHPPEDKAVQIPRLFWYACAYGIVVITTGVAYMAFNATTSSIEAFGTKLELTRALEREKEVLDTVEKLATAPAVATAPAPDPVLPWTGPYAKPPAKLEVPEDLPTKLKGWREEHSQQQQQVRQQPQQQQQQGR